MSLRHSFILAQQGLTLLSGDGAHWSGHADPGWTAPTTWESERKERREAESLTGPSEGAWAPGCFLPFALNPGPSGQNLN